ncbi:GntR family transcriptional regulator [Falsirhodobacter sp. alg1]|uniref:GntR family transcriptional regulator n=1 Tax=Falsirhodobacter sp. alg1 TaxID=1472418 RepID=UPI0005EF3EDA|nr:GntR family transcriptional regulator [Falsirhodobacter sp. alg1]
MNLSDVVSDQSIPSTQMVSATQMAYSAIRQMIVMGDLPPGKKLKIESIKELLQTGASPVREALSLLTSDQLVERIDQRGFRCAPVSAQNFAEILKLRCALEDMALRQSLANADDAWEERLVLAHHRLTRMETQSGNQFEAVHKAFHMTLLENCASPILMRYCSQLYDLNVRYRYLAGHALGYDQRDVNGEHRNILTAAIARDVEKSAQTLLQHYQKTGAFLTRTGLLPAV